MEMRRSAKSCATIFPFTLVSANTFHTSSLCDVPVQWGVNTATVGYSRLLLPQQRGRHALKKLCFILGGASFLRGLCTFPQDDVGFPQVLLLPLTVQRPALVLKLRAQWRPVSLSPPVMS